MNMLSKLVNEEHKGDTAIFSAPLGVVKKGHLEIKSGISNFDLTGDSASQDLFQGEFIGLIPDVSTKNERVIIRYPLSITEWFRHLLLANRHAAQVVLNTSIPWQIEIHGGAANLAADLRAFQLHSLMITGGVAEAVIFLPRPLNTIPIHITSGVSRLTFIRPEGVSARLKVDGGINHLAFDDQSYDSIGGGIRLETTSYKGQMDRYDISIGGGVSNLVVRTQAFPGSAE